MNFPKRLPEPESSDLKMSTGPDAKEKAHLWRPRSCLPIPEVQQRQRLVLPGPVQQAGNWLKRSWLGTAQPKQPTRKLLCIDSMLFSLLGLTALPSSAMEIM